MKNLSKIENFRFSKKSKFFDFGWIFRKIGKFSIFSKIGNFRFWRDFSSKCFLDIFFQNDFSSRKKTFFGRDFFSSSSLGPRESFWSSFRAIPVVERKKKPSERSVGYKLEVIFLHILVILPILSYLRRRWEYGQMHQISMKNGDMNLHINPGLKVTTKLVDTNFGPIRSKIKVVGSIQLK